MDGIENEFRIRTMQTELIEENSALRAEVERLRALLQAVADLVQTANRAAALADQG